MLRQIAGGDHNLVVRRDKRITGLIRYKRIGGTEFQSIFEMFGQNLLLRFENKRRLDDLGTIPE